jgi:PAS domain S-box-containing protein
VDVRTSLASDVRVLVVDDNPVKRLALRAVLAPLGYTIVEADSGREALRRLLAEDFAVILLDVRMPFMDGFETASLIRQRRQSEMTPIIFVTAFTSDEIQATDRYVEGAVDFIFAPVPPDELRAKVSVFANLFMQAEMLAVKAREVQVSVDQLRRVTDSAPIGIFETDSKNRYVYTNPRWSVISGIPAEEAAGRDWDSIIGAGHRNDWIVGLDDVSRDATETACRYEIKVPRAGSRIVLATSRSVEDADGAFAGWVGTLADITAETRAETAMLDARDAANEASRQKSVFLANMSHEIRTPMNGVIGMTDLLLETVLDDFQLDLTHTVRDSSEALLVIINNILDFSKVEAGMFQLESIEFDPEATVASVLHLLAQQSQAKGLALVANVDTSVPATIIGDPGRLRQILTNLVGNSIKFSQSGEVTVRARVDDAVAGPESSATTAITFEVTDTGIGIAPGELANIFDPFNQADTSISRKYGGTGLGLAICSHLVTLMGGRCGVTSELGRGSTFWFTIMAQPVSEPGALPNRRANPSSTDSERHLSTSDRL